MEQGAAQNSRSLPSEARLAFTAEFLDEARCRQWFIERYYPDGICCPDCKAPIESERSRATFLDLRRFTCAACGSQPKATKGTVLQDSPLTPRDLYLLSILIDLDIDDRETARIVGVSRETVGNWRDKFAALAEVGR